MTAAELSGDVTTSGSNAATLANTAVTPGSCTFCSATFDSKGRATSQSSGTPTGYTLFVGAAALNPSDATTYFIGGNYSLTPNTNSTVGRIYIPKTGTVKAVYFVITKTGTTGTSEQSTLSIRINNTTDTTISATVDTSVSTVIPVINAAMSLAVTVGDLFEIKWVTPTWVTNPTVLTFSGTVYIE